MEGNCDALACSWKICIRRIKISSWRDEYQTSNLRQTDKIGRCRRCLVINTGAATTRFYFVRIVEMSAYKTFFDIYNTWTIALFFAYRHNQDARMTNPGDALWSSSKYRYRVLISSSSLPHKLPGWGTSRYQSQSSSQKDNTARQILLETGATRSRYMMVEGRLDDRQPFLSWQDECIDFM